MSTDSDYTELRRFHNSDFDSEFAHCYSAYIKGDWEQAGKEVGELLKKWPSDGPTQSLNSVINEQHSGKAPPDWKGFRPLTSK
mmetsp:Transcript_40429/g.61674  ORF Transcript_40429/g.61674 Transcript_40429/m.61674 type:complete len:83 (+) Transcript_40429:2650-2898(+)